MDVDPREQRLRSAFVFMMAWTTVAVWILGDLVGQALAQAFGGAAVALGHAPGETSAMAVNLAGHAAVGAVALAGILRVYLAPPASAGKTR
jgi:hypothetical protein